MSGSFFVWAAIKIITTSKIVKCPRACAIEDVCVRADGCINKGRASTTGRWRKQSHLGTPDLVLGARHRGRKKNKTWREWCTPQGRAVVKGRERGVIPIMCAVNEARSRI